VSLAGLLFFGVFYGWHRLVYREVERCIELDAEYDRNDERNGTTIPRIIPLYAQSPTAS
jgi:hypothetical protein